MRQTWGKHDCLHPFGENDATIQIVVLPRRERGGNVTGLLTVRAKDQDLTADEFDAIGVACAMAAKRLRGRK